MDAGWVNFIHHFHSIFPTFGQRLGNTKRKVHLSTNFWNVFPITLQKFWVWFFFLIAWKLYKTKVTNHHVIIKFNIKNHSLSASFVKYVFDERKAVRCAERRCFNVRDLEIGLRYYYYYPIVIIKHFSLLFNVFYFSSVC